MNDSNTNGFLTYFQAQLSQSMANSKQIKLFMKVRENNNNWLLNLNDFKEVEFYNYISELAMTKPWVLGIASFKGQIYSIIEFKQMFNQNISDQNILDQQLTDQQLTDQQKEPNQDLKQNNNSNNPNNNNIATIIHEKYGYNIAFIWDDILELVQESNLDLLQSNVYQTNFETIQKNIKKNKKYENINSDLIKKISAIKDDGNKWSVIDSIYFDTNNKNLLFLLNIKQMIDLDMFVDLKQS